MAACRHIAKRKPTCGASSRTTTARSSRSAGAALPSAPSRVTRQARFLGFYAGFPRYNPRNVATPSRIPILYLILSVLVLVSVLPIWLYGTKVVADTLEKLTRNEMLLR